MIQSFERHLKAFQLCSFSLRYEYFESVLFATSCILKLIPSSSDLIFLDRSASFKHAKLSCLMTSCSIDTDECEPAYCGTASCAANKIEKSVNSQPVTNLSRQIQLVSHGRIYVILLTSTLSQYRLWK